MTKVSKWSDRSESIIPGCTGILILLVYGLKGWHCGL